MVHRKLNPRAAALHKALYNKQHPDFVEHVIPLPSVKFTQRVKALAEYFHEEVVPLEQLAKELHLLAAQLRVRAENENSLVYSDILDKYAGLTSRAVHYAGTLSGRYPQMLREANERAAVREREAQNHPERFHYDLAELLTATPIATSYILSDFNPQEDRVRQNNHPRDNANRNRPQHPGASIRGFRRGL